MPSELQWTPGAPNGDRRQNFAVIRSNIAVKYFEDLEWDYEVCVSCEIERITLFTLRGVCKHSFLETDYFPTICGGYIGFTGNMVHIW